MNSAAQPTRLKVINISADTLSVGWGVEPGFHLDIAIGAAGTEIERNELYRPLYWRLEDDSNSLVSIELSRRQGQLIMISVPFYTKPVRALPALTPDILLSTPGVPVFDRTLWPHVLQEEVIPRRNIEDFYDFPVGVRLELGADTLRIRLFDDPITEWIITDGTLCCELNAMRELCAVRLLGFGGKDRSITERYLRMETLPMP